MRVDATEIAGGWQEIRAYGTAVKIRPVLRDIYHVTEPPVPSAVIEDLPDVHG
jgi:hypothetical protein